MSSKHLSDWPSDPPTYSVIDPVIHPPTQWLTQWSTHLLSDWPSDPPTYSVIDPVIHPPT